MATGPAITEAEESQPGGVDTSDPKAVNRARKKAAREHRERLSVVGAVMEQGPGRLWLYELLAWCHIWQPSYVVGDSHATAFSEGQRNVGLRLLGDIMAAAPDLYVTMCKDGKAAYG